MPGALDVLATLSWETDTSSLDQAAQSTSKASNVTKELTNAIEQQGKAQQGTQQKVQMSVQEYRKLQESLKIVKKDSADYVDVLKKAGIEVEAVTKKHTSLRAQLRTVREELAAMEIAGQSNTKKFQELSVAAGQLQDQIGDTSSRIRVLASDTKYLDAFTQGVTAIAGGFAVAQGASALFGDENKELQQTIAKVTGALALLNGVQSIANALNKDSAFNILFLSKARAADTAAIATETVATEGATVATTQLNAALLANPIIAITAVVLALATALAIYASSSDAAEQEALQLNDALEAQNKILSLDLAGLERRTKLLKSQAEAAGKNSIQVAEIEINSLKRSIEIRKQDELQKAEALNKAGANNKISTEEYKKFQDEYNKATEARIDSEIELEVSKNNLIKDLTEKRKAILAQESKLRQDLQQADIDTLIDGREKEIYQLQLNTQDKIKALKAEKALSVQAINERNLLILKLEEELQQNIDKTIRKYADANTLNRIGISNTTNSQTRNLIFEQKDRVERAKNLVKEGKEGSEILLQIEIERLKKLSKVRQEYTYRFNDPASFQGNEIQAITDDLTEEEKLLRSIANIQIQITNETEKQRIAGNKVGPDIDAGEQRAAAIKRRAEADLRDQENRKKASKENTQILIEETNTSIQLIGQAANAFIDAEIRKTEVLIAEQEKRVDAARAAAEKGNTALFLEEKRRLDALTAEKEKYVEKQRNLNGLLAASQAAVNVIQTVTAVLTAAPGDPYSLPARIAAAVVAVVGGIATTVAAVKGQQEFFKGGHTGEGDDKEEAGVVHKNEYVMPASVVRKLGKKTMEDIHYGRIPLDTLTGNMSVNYAGLLEMNDKYSPRAVDSKTVQSLLIENKELRNEIKGMRQDLQNIGGTSVNIDETGVAAIADDHKRNKIEIKRLRK